MLLERPGELVGREELPAILWPPVMESDTNWFYTVSTQNNDSEFSDWIRYLFGASKCPECDKPFSLPDAIAEIEEE
jgi:hypothetical protein